MRGSSADCGGSHRCWGPCERVPMEMLRVELQGLPGGPRGTEVQAVCVGPPVKGVTRWVTRPCCSGGGLVLTMIPLAGGLRSPGDLPLSDPQKNPWTPARPSQPVSQTGSDDAWLATAATALGRHLQPPLQMGRDPTRGLSTEQQGGGHSPPASGQVLSVPCCGGGGRAACPSWRGPGAACNAASNPALLPASTAAPPSSPHLSS